MQWDWHGHKQVYGRFWGGTQANGISVGQQCCGWLCKGDYQVSVVEVAWFLHTNTSDFLLYAFLVFFAFLIIRTTPKQPILKM